MDTNGNTKELLIKDLCSRLPYGVIVNVKGFDYDYNDKLTQIYKGYGCSIQVTTNMPYDIEQVKPYLFPLSSLTSKQRTEIGKILTDTQKQYSPYGVVNTEGCDNLFICSVKQSNALINYCLSQHLDINGLIEKGLAIDATNLKIY